MSTFWSILKFGLPLLSQIVGFLLAMHGSMNAGKAAKGEYTISQQAGPVYGNLAAGLGLLGAGTAASHLIAAKSVQRAADSPPLNPPQGVDPVLHEMTIWQMKLATSPETSNDDLDSMNLRIKEWRDSRKKK